MLRCRWPHACESLVYSGNAHGEGMGESAETGRDKTQRRARKGARRLAGDLGVHKRSCPQENR